MHTINRFDKTNNTFIRKGTQCCDKCGRKNLEFSFSDLTRTGEDVDVFEFEKGVWDVCEICVIVYMTTRPDFYLMRS